MVYTYVEIKLHAFFNSRCNTWTDMTELLVFLGQEAGWDTELVQTQDIDNCKTYASNWTDKLPVASLTQLPLYKRGNCSDFIHTCNLYSLTQCFLKIFTRETPFLDWRNYPVPHRLLRIGKIIIYMTWMSKKLRTRIFTKCSFSNFNPLF
jgi:hypothetical protein